MFWVNDELMCLSVGSLATQSTSHGSATIYITWEAVSAGPRRTNLEAIVVGVADRAVWRRIRFRRHADARSNLGSRPESEVIRYEFTNHDHDGRPGSLVGGERRLVPSSLDFVRMCRFGRLLTIPLPHSQPIIVPVFKKSTT
jgi:hypothetical protein